MRSQQLKIKHFESKIYNKIFVTYNWCGQLTLKSHFISIILTCQDVIDSAFHTIIKILF